MFSKLEYNIQDNTQQVYDDNTHVFTITLSRGNMDDAAGRNYFDQFIAGYEKLGKDPISNVFRYIIWLSKTYDPNSFESFIDMFCELYPEHKDKMERLMLLI
jgi:hypothetical protein